MCVLLIVFNDVLVIFFLVFLNDVKGNDIQDECYEEQCKFQCKSRKCFCIVEFLVVGQQCDNLYGDCCYVIEWIDCQVFGVVCGYNDDYCFVDGVVYGQ